MGLKTIGTAQDLSLNSFTEHSENRYYLVIGFEVNHPEVYKNVTYWDDYSEKDTELETHDVLEDPGHSFMYLVKNNKATIFLSLGPMVSDKSRWAERQKMINGPSPEAMEQIFGDEFLDQAIYMSSKRAYGRGTPDYHIPEKSHLFRLIITHSQYDEIFKRTERIKEKILSGDDYYNIFDNNTCAKAVRADAISTTIPNLPWGKSAVMNRYIFAINPYAFYNEMKQYAKENNVKEFVIKRMENKWQKFILSIRENELPYDIIIENGELVK